MKSLRKKIITVFCITICWMFSFAGLFDFDYPRLNNADHLIYSYCDADRVVSAVAASYSDAAQKYNNVDVVIWGTAGNISKDRRSMTITGKSGGEISVNAWKAGTLDGIADGAKACVYGTLKISPFLNHRISVDAAHAEAVSSLDDNTLMSVYGGERYTSSDTVERTLATSGITYRIPSLWTSVRADEATSDELFDADAATDAECYYLDALNGAKDTECFVIFDYRYAGNVYESSRWNTRGIEKALMKNMIPKATGIFMSGVRDLVAKRGHFKTDPDYYRVNYEGSYSVEFVFIPYEGEDHMLVMMYIYKDGDVGGKEYEPAHLDDVLSVIRSLDPL